MIRVHDCRHDALVPDHNGLSLAKDPGEGRKSRVLSKIFVMLNDDSKADDQRQSPDPSEQDGGAMSGIVRDSDRLRDSSVCWAPQ